MLLPVRLKGNTHYQGGAWALLALVSLFSIHGNSASAGPITLRNISYDPTRELYQDYSAAFAKRWKDLGGGDVSIEISHAGSGKQARAVIDGLESDVVM